MATLNLAAPVQGAQNVIVINEDVTSLDLAFDSSNALFERADSDLLISFEDNSSIRLENFYDVYNAEFMPEFVLDGFTIAGEEFFAAFDANLMPAAGSAGGGTGSVATQGADLQSLESTGNSNPENNQGGTDGIDGNAGNVGTYTTRGLGSDLGYVNRTSFNLGDGDNGNGGENPLPPTYNLVLDTNEISGATSYTTKADEIEPDDIVRIQMPEQYQDDITVNPDGTVTISDELADYISSLAPGQNVQLQVTQADGSIFNINATGNNANDDHISISGTFSSKGGTIENVDPDHDDVNDPTFKFEGDTIDLGEGNDSVNLDRMSSGTILTGKGEDTITGGEYITGGTIDTGDDNDTFDITAVSGSTNIKAGDGDDTFNASWFVGSNSVVDGGAGNDTLSAQYLQSNGQILGGEGEDNIEIYGRLYGGTIDGGKGDDIITIKEATGLQGDNGAQVFGGEGNDTITVTNSLTDNGKILIDGGAGEDTIHVNWINSEAQNTVIDGGADNDTITVSSMRAGTVLGGDGTDTITIDSLDDKTIADGNNKYNVDAGTGNDNIIIKSMTDGKVNAGDGDDTIVIGVEGNTGTAMSQGAIFGAGGADNITLNGDMTGGVIYGDMVENGNGAITNTGGNATHSNSGNDNIIINGSMLGSSIIHLDSGEDKLVVTGDVGGDSQIYSGNGHDGSSESINTDHTKETSGIFIEGTIKDNAIVYGDDVVAGNMAGGRVETWEGEDEVVITGTMSGGTIQTDNINKYMDHAQDQTGNDTVRVNTMTGGLIQTMSNDDLVEVTTLAGGRIEGGYGDDTVNVTTMNGGIISGDSGKDNVNIDTMNGGAVYGGNEADITRVENLNGGSIYGGGSIKETDQTFVTNMTGGLVNTEYAEVENFSGGNIVQWENVNNDQIHANNHNIDIKVGNMTGGTITADSASMPEAYRDTAEDTIQISNLSGGTVNAGYADDTVVVGNMGLASGDSTPATINLDEGNDTFRLTGTMLDGTTVSNGKVNMFQGTVNGGAGNDTFILGEDAALHGFGDEATNSFLNGGDGNDSFEVYNMNGGQLNGDAGNDKFNVMYQGFGSINGGDGNDTINVYQMMNQAAVTGGEGNDTVTVTSFVNGSIDTGNGNDTVNISSKTFENGYTQNGVMSNGTISTGSGYDKINIETINGGSVDGGGALDMINITTMNNGYVTGGKGFDMISVKTMNGGTLSGGDELPTDTGENMGTGDSIKVTTFNAGLIDGGEGNDNIEINEAIGGRIDGGNGNDTITVAIIKNSQTTIEAGEGNDTVVIVDFAGSDAKINGGAGEDTFVLKGADGNELTLKNDGSIQINDETDIVIEGFENLRGGDHDDILTGNDSDNVLFGGEGSDLLTGGLGDDVFGLALHDFSDGANDVITDFGTGSDMLDLTAFKHSAYSIDFNTSGNDAIFTITDIEAGVSQTITLQGGSDLADSIQDQLNSSDFDGGIRI